MEETLWGQQPDGAGVPVSLQARDGSYGVKASMFWVPTNLTTERPMPGYDYDPRWFCDAHDPPDCPHGWPGWRWDQARGASLGRAYNYPHQSSVYLAMYLASAVRDDVLPIQST